MCTGGDELVFDVSSTSEKYSLPLSPEEVSPSSRGTNSGRASSSNSIMFNIFQNHIKELVTRYYFNPH